MSKAETDKSIPTIPGESLSTGTPKKAPPPRPGVRVVDRGETDPMIGRTVAGRYRIEARLGEGGMGAVYRVEHTHMRKKLALKVLHREMTGQEEIVARFEREAMAAAHIEHPNVAGATDFGKLEDGSFYLVLEYVEGISLRTSIDKGPLDWRRAVHIAAQVLAGLRRAHELGIIHRDLKPENVLLVDKEGDKDFVKILDFGIARVPIGSLTGRKGETGKTLTRAGMVYGTPEYMAPEQALGQGVDGRSDLYGVGVMLFEMLTGKRPYDNKDKVALLGQHVAGAIPSIRDRAPARGFSDDVEAIVGKLLSKSPDDRHPDAQTAADALNALLAAPDPPTTPAPTSSGKRAADASGSNAVAGAPADLVSAPFLLRQSGVSDGGAIVSGPVPLPLGTPIPMQVVAGTPTPHSAPHVTGAQMLISQSLPLQLDVPPTIPAPAPRKNPTPFIVTMVGLAIATMVVAIVAMFRGRPNEQVAATASSQAGTTIPSATTPSASTSAKGPVDPTSDMKTRTQNALGRLLQGEVDAAVTDLEALAAKYPDEPEVVRALAIAYSKTKRPLDALQALKKLLTISPHASSDPALESILDDALATPTAMEPAFAILSGPMGADGARILYDLSNDPKATSTVRARATKALSDPEVRKAAPPSIRALFELKESPTVCATRREIIERYRNDLDARALPFLKPMRAAAGCGGFFKNADCWPCLHEGHFLETVLKEIDDRQKPLK